MNATLEQTELKTPSTRILDLLHGWGDYVASEENAYPDTLDASEIADLYQLAGNAVFRDYPDIETERDAVCRFVTEKVLPLLLK